MENLLKEIQEKLDAFVKDAEAQVEKGNKAAGTRARKASLELTKLFKEFRKQSIEIRFLPALGQVSCLRKAAGKLFPGRFSHVIIKT